MRPIAHRAPLALCMLSFASAALAAAPSHPLDPLSWQEHSAVLEVLHAAGKLDEATRFTRIALSPPEKSAVWAWKPGSAFTRRAEAVVRQDPAVFEAIVDLDARKLLSWQEKKGVQAMWLGEEYEHEVIREALKNPYVLARLKARGIESTHFLHCLSEPPGYFGEERYAGRRIARIYCRPRAGFRNQYARRLEGLAILVDLHTKEILEIADDENVAIPPGGRDFDASALDKVRKPATPIELAQPLGPGFTLDGHVVSWDRWRFHVRSDARVGTIVAAVAWRDGERDRPVLYEGHLSEIFVPYMDPRRDWYVRTFIDAGEYSAGGLADSLTAGVDCPSNAVYLNGIVTQDAGWPKDKPRVACLFERYAGDVSWRHAAESRPQRELVVRMITLVGNYDYVVDWRFQTDGQIRVAIGATGVVEAKMARAKDARARGRTRDDAYGRFVDEHVVAVNHDHYFNFRLDLDVDGPRNSFLREDLVPRELPEGHPRRSVWVVEPHRAAREEDARLSMDPHRPAIWRVTSGSATGRLGYPTSFQLLPGHSAHTLLAEDDYARRRAGFIDHHLWVTPYAADERYAAGDYPTLSEAGQGLPAWTARNRRIADTDIVLWHTIGMHHVVRAEEWPVMPVLWHEFLLRPFDFLDGNPAVDLASTP